MAKTNVLKCAWVALLFALPLSAPGVAETANFSASVTRTLVTTETNSDGSVRFGGCMVLLDVSPSASNLNCPGGNWVTFSCSGDHTSRSNAMRLLDSAQLAFVARRRVRIFVDDSMKHNGWCFAYRVDVVTPRVPEED